MICLNENCLLVDYLGTFVLSSFMVHMMMISHKLCDSEIVIYANTGGLTIKLKVVKNPSGNQNLRFFSIT